MTNNKQVQYLQIYTQQNVKRENVKEFTFSEMLNELLKDGKGLLAIDVDDLIMCKNNHIKYDVDYIKDGYSAKEKYLRYNNGEAVNITSEFEDKKYVIFDNRKKWFLGVY